MIEVLVSYAAGTSEMLETCLASLRRHDAGKEYDVAVLTGDPQACEEAKPVAGTYGASCFSCDVSMARTSSGRHGRMLDAAVASSKAERVLTLDSDCFPVADGWMSDLAERLDAGADVAGIAWPWAPPPDTVGRDTIEWRVRRQHCCTNTQVACQMVRTDLIRKMGLRFADPSGDDTNFGLMDKVHAAGMRVSGVLPTRCALPDCPGAMDPEDNRHVCVVYGDAVYHHGGASREVRDEFSVQKGLYDAARARVKAERGAEWVLRPECGHVYRFDDEEAVARAKMDMMYRQMPEFLRTRSSLFGEWT